MSASFESVVGASAAWRALPGSQLIRVTGSDRVRFLDGMLSVDVGALATGRSADALQLDRKGHVLSLVSTLALPDAFLLVAEADTGLALWDALETILPFNTPASPKRSAPEQLLAIQETR